MGSAKPDKSADSNYLIYVRCFSYLRRYLSMFISCLVLSVLISLFHFGTLGMIQPLGDILFGGENSIFEKTLPQLGSVGVWLNDFLKQYMQGDIYRTLYFFLGLMLAITIIKNVLRFLQEYLSGYLTYKVTMDISNDLFVRVNRLSLGFFAKEGANQISAHFMNDLTNLSQGYKVVLGKGLREPLKAAACLTLALLINWKLTLLAAVVLPVALFFIKTFGKKVKRGAKKGLSQQGNILSILQETFHGMKIVKAYQMENYLQGKFAQKNTKLFRYHMKVVMAEACTNPAMEVLVTLGGIGMLMISAQMIFQGDMSKGEFCAFYAALAALFDPIRKLAEFNNRMNSASAAGERLFKLMDQEPEIREATNAVALAPLQRGIEFKNVTFSYKPGVPVLRDISFSVRHGENIAIVGPSGAGKSTLASLMLRFYDPDKGSILLDGVDIRQATFASLRQQIGLVTQDAILFNDTVLANIVCHNNGNLGEDVLRAANAAYAHPFIDVMAQKYETVYGDGGIDLSGGQKHRVALARAIFRSPAILILDEAMANLDAESEFLIKQALEKFVQGRTTFIIAHRFSTIEKADRIMVLQEGELEAFGKHQELLEKSKTYRKLYERQMLNLQNM